MDQDPGRNKSILFAFAGQDIEQLEKILEVQDGYECWNLRKLSLDKFIYTLKKRIPPVNNNVLSNYLSGAGESGFGITDKLYKACSWGLLIPDGLDNIGISNYAETLFLLNLYSPKFLYPLFYATDLGIMRVQYSNRVFEIGLSQKQSHIFSTKEFVLFFKNMMRQSQYGSWMHSRALQWSKEDWRLFVAAMLYSGLTEYDNSKTPFGWQRESADMAAILESLFTAGDTQNEEVGYRLRKRIAVLLSHRFSSIEKDIKDLYAERSAFVHGSFFAQIAKDSKVAHNNLPIPDFDILYKQKEYVRWALVAYLHLAQLVRSHEYGNATTVSAILEKAIIDIELRNTILKDAETVLSLLPEPTLFR